MKEFWQHLAGFTGTALFAAFIGWLLWRRLKASEDPARLAAKWTLSGVMIGLTLWVAATNFKEGGGWGAAFVIAIMCAVCGIVLGITWGANIATMFARPITDLFDGGGGDLTLHPCYSIAEARRKQGKYPEAMAEVRKELAKRPGDYTGTMMLAEIQAENMNDLPGAQNTIERLLAEAERTPSEGAFALNRLSDWHLNLAQDPEAARTVLQQIVDRFPDTEFAYLAGQRIAHMTTPELLTERREPHRVQLGEYQQNIGLLESAAIIRPPADDQAAIAAGLVEHLEKHPQDAEARERLACIYANHYQRMDLAADQLEELIAQPNAPAKHVAHWLNVLADLHVKQAGDANAARLALARIVELYPRSAVAENAQNRIVRLPLELRAKKQSQVVKLGS